MAISLFLALSLSADALGVGVSYGLRGIRFPLSSRLLMALETGGFLLLFLQAGKTLASWLPSHIAEILSVLVLLGFGIFFCIQGIHPPSTAASAQSPMTLLRNPSCCDQNHSAVLEPKEALLLGLILSADTVGVGISAAAGGFSVFWLPLFTALAQTVFLTCGAKLGNRLILSPEPKEHRYALLSGGILIGIAIIRCVSIF